MSETTIKLIIFLVVAYFLSFILCLMIYRLPREKNVIKYEAICPNEECGKPVKAWKFIPIFGFIFSKGKYGCCDEKLSKSRLLVPLFLMALAALAVYITGFEWARFNELFDKGFRNANLYLNIHSILLFLFSAVMLVVIFADYETLIIPDTCHVLLFILGVLAIVFKMTSVLWGILGCVIFFVSFFVIMRVAIRVTGNEDALGGGDVKLMGVCGLFLGAGKCLLGLLIGSFMAFLIEGFLLLTHIKKRGEGVAFGPYLAIGMLIAAFFGNAILYAYTKMLGIA